MATIHIWGGVFDLKTNVAQHKVPCEACVTLYKTTSAMCHSHEQVTLIARLITPPHWTTD